MREIGVLWSGDHVFPGTAETLDMLRSKGKISCRESTIQQLIISPGKRVVFVTNNSTKSRADYKKKLDGLGIPSTIVRPFLLP